MANPAGQIEHQRIAAAVSAWRSLAATTTVTWRGNTRSWTDHIRGEGFVDETELVQRFVFPAFATELLGFEVGVNLSPEQPGEEGKPDFTPADPVTHPFVFETKSSRKGSDLDDQADLTQVLRYLTDGRPRIRKVALTNLVGLRVFDLDASGDLQELYAVRLRDLVLLPEEQATHVASGPNLVRFLDEFSRRELSREQKLSRVRAAHPWEPLFEVTASDWIIARLDRVVSLLYREVLDQIGLIADPASVTDAEREAILDELRLLGSRIAEGLDDFSLTGFLEASGGTTARVVLEQYAMHVAYYTATRLLLVRVWEDLGLLKPMLHDGGLDEQLRRFDDVIGDVIEQSYRQAGGVYRSLFQHSTNYSWFVPADATYVDVIYELAFTFLGRIDSDVVGEVYERLLARIDRKLLGQYFTPRDIIGLIWDLIGTDDVLAECEAQDRLPRTLDIATGSGGFLVELLTRLRGRLAEQLSAGAAIDPQDWLTEVSENVNGVEVQYFSRYLAELNLLVQLGQVVASDPKLRIAPIGVVAGDTLSLHEPEQGRIAVPPTDQPGRARRLKDVADADFAMDAVCGNPPYIGEKLAAPLLSRTRREYPYWEQFVAEHLDYLYWFLILGISKLREGGRFGFITTEYWLRASGARPLRDYVARECEVERIVLFRDLRLFRDAPGQHSMIVSGRRTTSPHADGGTEPGSVKPLVSIYRGAHIPDAKDRGLALDAIRGGQSVAGVTSFRSQVSPKSMGGASWGDLVLTRTQLRQRSHLDQGDQVGITISKGVETTLNKLGAKTAERLPETVLARLDWPGRKAGIQLLTAAEVERLEPLNDAERRVVRPVVNTRDIYPYAVVLPSDHTSVLYLVKPEAIDGRTSAQSARTWPFPDGLPSIERHLIDFKPILEKATESRGEKRPWWSLHRPRFDVIGRGSEGTWEPYCLTTRWGGGNRFVVGLAPGNSSPASGLHILRPDTPGLSAGYLAALYNASIYQAIVDSLPPGNLRAEDLGRLGAPLVSEHVQAVEDAGYRLADCVTRFVLDDAARFPRIPEALRHDVGLPELPTTAWVPGARPRATQGQLLDVRWVEEIEIGGRGRQLIAAIEVSESLFGQELIAIDKATGNVAGRVRLAPETPNVAIDALRALLTAHTDAGLAAADVGSVLVPVEISALQTDFENDLQVLNEHAAEYRGIRSSVDQILSDHLV